MEKQVIYFINERKAALRKAALVRKMSYCRKCGAEIHDGELCCPNCGEPTGEMRQTTVSLDASSEKVMACLGYFTWIGLVIALLITKGQRRSEFLRFHMNQAIVLDLVALLSLIPVIGIVVGVACFVARAYCIIGAAQENMWKLPVIGDITIIKE